MTTLGQRTFSSGELAPGLYARTDLTKYASGLRTCRNVQVSRAGNLANRSGTSFTGEVKDSSKTVRLIPFIYSDDVSYVLEFGEYYIRFIKDGAYVFDGGSPYEIVTSYPESSLADINHIQSADVVTLVHNLHPPMELKRLGATSWEIDKVTFAPETNRPGNLGVSGSSGSEVLRYKVTAINEESFEESLVASQNAALAIVSITNADPCVVEITGHGLANDDEITIVDAEGLVELNGRNFYVDNVTANTFELYGVDSTDYGVYTANGDTHKIFVEISSNTPSTGTPNVISWSKSAGATEYNIYKETNGIYGLIGIATGTSFNDINITPDTVNTPPSSRNPFIGTGNYPSTVTYIQQRLGFANTINDPEKIYLSKTGNFKNFTTSSPLQDDDAISFNMVGKQINAVKSMIDLGKLVIMTSGGEWSAAGDASGMIKPTDINTKQYSYNGSGGLQPIIIDGKAIYQQARGSIIRDLGFNYEVDGYSGNDLTIFSYHLFDNFTIVDWAYQQIPNSTLWVVRSDGALLGLTLVRSQQVMAWHVHDFDGGFVENVAVVPAGNEDRLFVTVKRTINGTEKRYIEYFTTRQVNDIEDMKMLDSNLTYDGRNTDSNHTMTITQATGNTGWLYSEKVVLTSSEAFFAVGDIGNSIFINGLRCKVATYTSDTIVEAYPSKTVAVELQNVAISEWARAVDELSGLDHLEGKDVSVFGDGFVVASPYNESYETVTVSGGVIQLDKAYSVIHVGLPYTSDIETLDVDVPQGTIVDKKKIVSSVNLYVEKSRGAWIGSESPEGSNSLEGLIETKLRSDEDYDSPIELKTDVINVNIRPEWNSNGRVFIRQVDPIPLTILSISPAGKFGLN